MSGMRNSIQKALMILPRVIWDDMFKEKFDSVDSVLKIMYGNWMKLNYRKKSFVFILVKCVFQVKWDRDKSRKYV